MNKSNIPNSLINLKLNQAILTLSHHFVNCEKIIYCMPPIFTDRKGTVNTPKFGLYWQNFNEESEYGFGGFKFVIVKGPKNCIYNLKYIRAYI